MPRQARVVIPDHPHHVTQRDNRRMPVFFCEGDYKLYLSILAEEMPCYSVAVWAYCLMPNHVHMIVCPADMDGMAGFFRVAHRRYTSFINRREGWIGHLWQDRFGSEAMDEPHALMTAR
jgi:putative transposase